MGGACSKYRGGGDLHIAFLVGKPERKGPLGRPSLRWEDNIKMALQVVECGVWTALMWLRIGTGSGHL